MRTEDIFALGLGLTPPWQVLSQRLDTEKAPHELHLVLGADRGATYPCPTCGRNCCPETGVFTRLGDTSSYESRSV